MINPKIFGIIPTYIGNTSKLHLTLKTYSQVAHHICLFVNKTEAYAFNQYIKKHGFNHNVSLITHSIPTSNKPHFGPIRNPAFNHIQTFISPTDVAIMLDDDLVQSRIVNLELARTFKSRNAERNTLSLARNCMLFKHSSLQAKKIINEKVNWQRYTQLLQPTELKEHIIQLTIKAQQLNYPFITINPNSKPGSCQHKTQYKKAFLYAGGWIGFFKNSPNLFDPRFRICEDWNLAIQTLSTFKKLVILSDKTIVQNFNMEPTKYNLQNKDKQEAIKKFKNIYFNGSKMITTRIKNNSENIRLHPKHNYLFN